MSVGMSLFAAYQKCDSGCEPRPSTSEDIPAHSTGINWLSNSSYVPPKIEKPPPSEVALESDSDSSSVEVLVERKAGKKSKDRKRRKRLKTPEKPELKPVKPKWWFSSNEDAQGEILLDKWRELENFQYTELYSRHKAKYRYSQAPAFVNVTGQRKLGSVFSDSDPTSARKKRYFFVRNVKRFVSAAPEEPKSQQKQTGSTVLKDYIELIDKKVLDQNDQELVWDDAIQMYRRPDQKFEKTPEPLELDDCEPPENAPAEILANFLNRRLQQSPHDVEGWLKFVDLQDLVYLGVQFGEKSDGKKESKISADALIERKLSILDRALRENPANVCLKVRRLELAATANKIDRQAVTDHWQKIEFTHPNSLFAWSRQIAFFRDTFATFSVAKQVELYDRCIKRLRHVLSGAMRTHPAEPGTAEFILNVFLQRCQFLFDAGWTEKAWGSIQAAVEFNFFAPDSAKKLNHEERMALFEEFWSSDSPRFGDAGAEGWLNWTADSDNNLDSKNDESHQKETGESVQELLDQYEDTVITNSVLNCAQRWARIEIARAVGHWSPLRKADDTLEDPDRAVLFDDIEISVFTIGEPLLRATLLLAALRFAKVHLPCPMACLQRLSAGDNGGILSESEFNDIWSTFDALPQYQNCIEPGWSGCDLSNALADRVLDLTEAVWNNEGLPPSAIQCVRMRNTRNRLASGTVKERVKAFRRAAKCMLGDLTEGQNMLPVYVQYADELAALGAWRDAQQALHATISSASTPSNTLLTNTNILHALLTLVRTWLRANLLDDSSDWSEFSESIAQSILGEESGHASVLIVKAKKAVRAQLKLECEEIVQSLEQEIENILHSAHTITANPLIEFINIGGNSSILLVMLQSFLDTATCSKPRLDVITSIESLVDSLVKRVSELQKNKPSVAFLLRHVATNMAEWMLLLLQSHHKRHVLARPIDLKQHLFNAATKLPHSGELSKLLVQQLTAGFNLLQLNAHFRRALAGTGHFGTSVDTGERMLVACASAVFAQVLRGNMGGGGSVQRLVKGLRMATEHLPGVWQLWHIWLTLVLANSSISATSADRVLLQPERVYTEALRSCPGAKRLYLDAILCAGADENKVRRLVDVLTEKQIRLRAPLEEIDMLRRAATAKLETQMSMQVDGPDPEPENTGEDRDAAMSSSVLIEDDDSIGFGQEDQAKRLFKRPYVVGAHVAFRSAAIFVYLFEPFISTYIVLFLVIIFLLCLDFWTVKNVTGRLLVGLRWWNFVDNDGKSHWRYEARKDQSRVNKHESMVFWATLIVCPLLWSIFAFARLVSLRPAWVIVCVMGAAMNGANLYGYVRCKYAGSGGKLSDVLRKQMLQTMWTSATAGDASAAGNTGSMRRTQSGI